MGPEPGRERVSCAIGQAVERPMALQVNQQGAIGASPTPGPSVPPKDRGRRHGWIGPLADEAQQRIGTGGHRESSAQPCSGFAAEREPQGLQRRGQAHGMLRRGPHDLRQAFSEGLSRAGSVHATKATDVQDQTHGILPQRKIARAARVVALDTRRRFPTARATGRGCGAMGSDRLNRVALADRGDLAPRQGKGQSGWHQD